MIHVVLTRPHAYTIERYLACTGRPLAPNIQALAYEDIVRRRSLPADTYILTDFDRLSASKMHYAAELATRLDAHPGAQVVNVPSRWKGRFELLHALQVRHDNPFRVHRVDVDPAVVRFPAFLRLASDHQGDRGGLLDGPDALSAAIGRLRRKGKAASDMMIVEFLDTRDAEGRYRKYGAFIVGGQILARHLFFGNRWMLKAPLRRGEAELAEEYEYVKTNPHVAPLQAVFAEAGVQYGRVDYTVHDGRLCIFEVNSNPMISIPEDPLEGLRDASDRIFASRFKAALERMDTAARDGPPVVLPRWQPTWRERVTTALGSMRPTPRGGP